MYCQLGLVFVVTLGETKEYFIAQFHIIIMWSVMGSCCVFCYCRLGKYILPLLIHGHKPKYQLLDLLLINYSKTCVKWSFKNRQNKGLNDKW